MDILGLVDAMAIRWMNWRIERSIETRPDLEQFKVEHFTANDRDGIELIGQFPAAVILAEELSKLLDAVQAENYYSFDIIPRLNKNIRGVRVTVQWANGLSPAVKAAKLEKENAELRERLGAA